MACLRGGEGGTRAGAQQQVAAAAAQQEGPPQADDWPEYTEEHKQRRCVVCVAGGMFYIALTMAVAVHVHKSTCTRIDVKASVLLLPTVCVHA